ncbi:DUF2604 domain-containing protein [Parablastomonas sp. CN1-191]|uniref:DUF2604 domain-containing protein n=1 Tax=Parablastomonas sp. CN1-191 TaxID=3400908 RepID=UPI003BF7FE63
MANNKKPDDGGTGGGHGGGNAKVDLDVVVGGGESVSIKAKLDDTLHDVAVEALKKSQNKGQPIENWDLRDEPGAVLDLARTVGSYGFASGTLLSLTLKAGVAG